MIAVSGCLVGLCCRYDGKEKTNKKVMSFLKDKSYVTICPEQMGGLSTPRPPAEIISMNPLLIKNNEGLDVTPQFVKGVQEVMKIIDLHHIETVVLKSKSPSCGKYQHYDGTFTRTLVDGPGILADALLKNGVKIYSEEDIEKI